MNTLALLTIIIWPVIPLFWIPVHLFPVFFRKIKIFTYMLPLFTWMPVAILVYINREFILQWQLSLPLFMVIAGTLLLTAGTMLHIWTAKLLGIPGIIGMHEISAEGKVSNKGAFSVVRHPTYLAHTIMFTGIFFMTGSIAVFIVTVLDLVIINLFVIPLEEKELIARFGDEYRNYMEKVPGFFPRLKKLEKTNP